MATNTRLPTRHMVTALALAALWLPVSSHANPLDPTGFASLGALTLGAGQYFLDTSGAAPTLQDAAHQTLYTGVLFDQGTVFNRFVAVFDFQSIAIGAGATLVASGDKPLALLSQSSVNFAGTLDASGRRGGDQGAGTGGAGGPGAGAGGAGSLGSGQAQAGGGPGGGQGGFDGLGNCSWGNGGAYGGDGSGIDPCLPVAMAYGDLPKMLLAGSGGGGTGKNLFGTGAGGGGGGGAVEFGAVNSLTFAGGSQVLAQGATGGGGTAVISGGGSGGGLFFHAPTISFETSAQGLAAARADGDSGGRIAFLTSDGTVSGNLASVTVAGGAFGHPGVITFGGLAQPVPEPSTLALLAGGLAAVAGLSRCISRRRSGPAQFSA